jgi:hypothetical protein
VTAAARTCRRLPPALRIDGHTPAYRRRFAELERKHGLDVKRLASFVADRVCVCDGLGVELAPCTSCSARAYLREHAELAAEERVELERSCGGKP